MSKLTSLQRKLAYLVAMLVLFIPVIVLGRPSEGGKSANADPGGVLAQLRRDNDLKESALGKVDPASATMNLVLLGMRGIAVNLLWQQAQDLQKTKSWAELRAVTESITQLQPHYLKVWDHSAWNLAYNVSADWDMVPDRYFWVKEGMKFYQQGVEQNFKYPEMQHKTGICFMHKIGRADEWRQYRRYFLKDPNTELFGDGPDPAVNPEARDNHLVAEKWFRESNRVMTEYGKEQHVMAHPIFRSYPGRAIIEYAQAKQKEGMFGEVTRQAWENAYDEWVNKWGREDFPSEAGPIHLELSRSELEDLRNRGETDKIRRIDQYQAMCNFHYWRLRCQVEREPNTVDARRELYEGEQASFRGDFVEARKLLESGMQKYADMLKKYPELGEHSETIEDAMVAMLEWRSVLQIEGEPVPDNYPLKAVWENNQGGMSDYTLEYRRRRNQYK
jgi:hypothetical protein